MIHHKHRHKGLMVFSLLVLMIFVAWVSLHTHSAQASKATVNEIDTSLGIIPVWRGPSDAQMPKGEEAELIHYGKELVQNTAFYLGPKGKISAITNGMNCQNCHLEAGTKPFGNNFFAVKANYPKLNLRSGQMEGVAGKVNECLTRSLHGTALDTNSRELKAMVAYITWLGTGVDKGKKPEGSVLKMVPYMERAALPDSGKLVFESKCAACHQVGGEGIKNVDGNGFQYPPLWGNESFTKGAAMYRISNLAAFVRSNMPNGTTFKNPELTESQAWDVAAYIVSKSRSDINSKNDWADIASKPIDLPFGPYTDGFSETQHQFGPFKPILQAKATLTKK